MTDNMADNEIIKALECCKSQECAECSRLCNHFPDSHECKVDLMEKVYNLIDRQNAEIERLQNHIKNSFDGLLKQYEESVIKTAKSEAVREFAERVNQLTTSYWFDNINKEHIDYIVKEIVKEMVGDEECTKRQKNFFAS